MCVCACVCMHWMLCFPVLVHHRCRCGSRCGMRCMMGNPRCPTPLLLTLQLLKSCCVLSSSCCCSVSDNSPLHWAGEEKFHSEPLDLTHSHNVMLKCYTQWRKRLSMTAISSTGEVLWCSDRNSIRNTEALVAVWLLMQISVSHCLCVCVCMSVLLTFEVIHNLCSLQWL